MTIEDWAPDHDFLLFRFCCSVVISVGGGDVVAGAAVDDDDDVDVDGWYDPRGAGDDGVVVMAGIGAFGISCSVGDIQLPDVSSRERLRVGLLVVDSNTVWWWL